MTIEKDNRRIRPASIGLPDDRSVTTIRLVIPFQGYVVSPCSKHPSGSRASSNSKYCNPPLARDGSWPTPEFSDIST